MLFILTLILLLIMGKAIDIQINMFAYVFLSFLRVIGELHPPNGCDSAAAHDDFVPPVIIPSSC